LIAELGEIPNRSAAERRDCPASTAFTTRSRRSLEQAFGIHAGLPPSQHGELEFRLLGNPHAIQIRRKML
jgi:hypothetical protein